MANSIVRRIANTVQGLSTLQYSIIIDGTQDVSGVEQEAICIRYVDHDLVPHEDFIGLYEVSSTTGKDLARMATDVLLRLNLPLSCLRGQTYDGAANSSGQSKGVQAVLREKQPLALYVHCSPHCVNLVTQTAYGSSPVVSDALNLVHKLGTLYYQSGKYKTIFKEIAQSEAGSFRTLKPLCPTRWLVRIVAIQAVKGQYEEVLLSLEEMAASGSSEMCTTARGLLERFQKGHTLLGLLLASEVLKELECLNRSLQSKTGSVTGMLAAVDCVKKTLEVKRSDESFHQSYAMTCDMISEMGIETIQMPHIRRPPKRYTGNAVFTPASTEEHDRVEYFSVLDAVDVQLTKRFDQSSFDTLNKLERELVSGKVEDDVVSL
ncbi:cell cycle checkpoint control protein RAD9A isoform X2 [Anguilla anguilla]|uniref:cell cycle checkpoint control protein RAD9A isoform X2 n=1 Tax=Anguilla anguilla TaxID=7936 RepID=UPI0015B2C931|nr:cell cycle checkpoint control protein RAD9A isoform X2 [Anguilla anguilla]